jgi:hypothetical protein
MNRPSVAQLEMAARLLAHEGAGGTHKGGARTPAGRIYEKLHAHMDALVGVGGVDLLFIRSAARTRGPLAAVVEGPIPEGAAKLREHLLEQDPAVDANAAAALFAYFFKLVTGLIGERLTAQVIRRAWPTFGDYRSTENKP